jgi:Flp pilus assembly protein TadG
MARILSRFRSFGRRQDGAVLVEFAILGPVLLVMLLGIIAYGGYFWLSHAVQQVANDAARAALSGLDTAERSSLAQSSMTGSLANYAFLDAASAHVTVASDAINLKVSVRYDASASPFWALGGLVPLPSSTITRQASIRLGGY